MEGGATSRTRARSAATQYNPNCETSFFVSEVVPKNPPRPLSMKCLGVCADRLRAALMPCFDVRKRACSAARSLRSPLVDGHDHSMSRALPLFIATASLGGCSPSGTSSLTHATDLVGRWHPSGSPDLHV